MFWPYTQWYYASMVLPVATPLAAIALAGLLLQRAVGWWWADAVAALVIAALLAWQGARALLDRE